LNTELQTFGCSNEPFKTISKVTVTNYRYFFSMEINRTNDLKYIDATQLSDYLDLLSRRQHARFVTAVCVTYGCNRQTFFNWKYMACCIPDEAKDVIENIAGCHIFTSPE
jgi:hypothetical protein